MNYTYEDWQDFINAFNYSDNDIALIIGKTRQNVNALIQPGRDLPSWAKGMLHIWKNNNSPEPLPKQLARVYHELTGNDIKNTKP